MNRRRFLKRAGLWVPGAIAFPAIVRAQLGDPAFVAALQSPSVSDPLLNGLVGWWKLDDGSGTAVADSSGNGNAGAFDGSLSWVTGKLTYGLSSSGQPNGVTLSNASILRVNSAGSVCIWANRASDIGNGGMICSNNFNTDRDGVGLFFSVNSPTADLRVELSSASSYQLFFAGYSLSNSTWYHFVVTWNGSDVVTYLNGANKTTRAQTITPAIGANNWTLFHEASQSASYYFQGILNGARIYNRALSDSEVAAIYALGGS